MRVPGSRTTARAAAVTLGLAAVLTAGSPALAQVPDGPRPPVGADPVVPGPSTVWEVELKDSWASPAWTQPAGPTTVLVHLDCGDAMSFRPPQYYIQLIPHGRMMPMVMPQPVPCGVTHSISGDQLAGTYQLFLAKASNDGVALRGKVAVSTP